MGALPPGDAGLTRRVKALGPTWTMVEVKGRKRFSKGMWAPSENIDAARSALDAERATPAYQKRLDADRARREREQQAYVLEFEGSVLKFLRFAEPWALEQNILALLVSQHATPVGSGTVARTERIPVEQRAEAAVIAWMRHQTTAYDNMEIERRKGARREVRRDLAEISRAVLNLHRVPQRHAANACPLCRALAPVIAKVPEEQVAKYRVAAG
ncbi:MAG: DUF2293 domain-containing protein [Polyangiaceae bacterium]